MIQEYVKAISFICKVNSYLSMNHLTQLAIKFLISFHLKIKLIHICMIRQRINPFINKFNT